MTKVPQVLMTLFSSDQQIIKSLRQTEDNPNITSEKTKALHQLKNNTTIVIKPADKGSMTVVMDWTGYLREATRQLQDTD